MKRTCDETKLAPESPPKRVLFSSSSATAVKFLLSPKILPALDAIPAKEQESERVKFMPVENKEISLEEARTRTEGGQDILVSPRGLNTNAEFARMREVADLFKGLDMKLLRDFFEGLDESSVYANLLYKSMVGASSEVCEADLIKITSSCLDYYVKSKFQGDATKYDRLVGQGLAFSSSSGDNIMYSRLLSFVDNKMHAPDLCSLGKELLFAAESELLQDIGMHHTDPDRLAEHVRKSMRDFSRSLLRKERLTSAHLLSEVLFVDCHRPINEQDLSHKFHKVKDNLWNMDDPRVLFKMGVRVMVLEDLKRKFETVGLREGYLLYHIGLNVMQYFLQEKVPFSMGFTFGNLKVFVKKAGQEVSLDHNYDLSTLKQALPPI